MAPRRKLTGAQAALFAAVCHHYINEAETDCNDCPDATPIFSQLSRAQRLKLVADVAVGMLCEDEPLPPNTIQHNSTFRAIIEILFVAIEVEIDTQSDYEYDIGEDLLIEDDVRTATLASPEEREENGVKFALIEHRAEKNLKKLKKGKDVGEFHVDENREMGMADVMTEASKLGKIFAGGPVSKRTRSTINKRTLNSEEKMRFYWRRLCDAALQEDTPANSSIPLDVFSLCKVNFDWRSQSESKWYMALNLLLDTKLMDYGSATDRALINGEVNYSSYADPSQLPRVKTLEKNIDLLLRVYASSWDPKLLAIDSRRIFAVCTTELYGPYYHKDFVLGLLHECQARGVDLTEPGKNYQARLDVFREIHDDFIDGCEYPFDAFEGENMEAIQRNWKPKKEGPKALGFEERRCCGPGKQTEKFEFNGQQMEFKLGFDMCFETENLQCCSRCKAVLCE